MRILVTGGAGYIGSHCVRRLLEAGHEPWVYDNLSRGHAAAVPSGRLIVGDLFDQQKLAKVLQDGQIDAVMHFAALALVGESAQQPHLYYGNNVAGSYSLLEAMRRTGVSRIVFSSTTATYGAPAQMPIAESTPQHPINPYGFTKLAIERMLDDYASAYGIAAVVLRYFNAAGAALDGSIGEDHSPESHLIPIVLQVALGQRERLTIFGDDYSTSDGTCIRDYVHVVDLSDAHLAALGHLHPGKVLKLNLGTGRGYSVKEVVEVCRRVTGHPIPTSVGPRRAGDPPALVADARLAREVLDWAPQFPELESIVETAWNWHHTHPLGFAIRDAASRASHRS
jgi:UDP-glucose 4-epimerase